MQHIEEAMQHTWRSIQKHKVEGQSGSSIHDGWRYNILAHPDIYFHCLTNTLGSGGSSIALGRQCIPIILINQRVKELDMC